MGAIDEYIYLLDEAFGGKGRRGVEREAIHVGQPCHGHEDSWRAVLPSGKRSIESVVLHVGSCKVM
jgi:hypothetical protein